MRSEACAPRLWTVQQLIDKDMLEIGDGYRATNSELAALGPVFARAGNVNNGFDFAGADRLGTDGVARAGAKRSRPGDVVFTSKGTVGRFAYVSAEVEEFVYSPQLCFWRVKNDSVIDARWLFYWLQGADARKQFNAVKGNTDMADYVSLRDQKRMQIALPCREEQRRIVSVLGSLDERIETGSEVVKCAQRTRDLVLTNAVRDEARTVELPQLARFVNGRAFTKQANQRGLPILRIRELNSGIGVGTLWSDADSHIDNTAFAGDLLFSWSGSLDVYRWAGPEALINQHIFKVVPIDGTPQWYAEFWVRHHLPAFQRIARDKATTMGHIKREHLTNATVVPFSAASVSAVSQAAASLDEVSWHAEKEARSLMRLRDLLLPRLVSGRIRVPPTEDENEAVETVLDEISRTEPEAGETAVA